MSHLLAVEGVPYRVVSGWFAFVRASLVWLLLSMPILTAPAATVALLCSVQRILAGDAPLGLVASWGVLRRSFGSALRLAAFVGLGYLVVVSALLGPSPGGAFDLVLPLVVVPVSVAWVLGTQWCLVILADRPASALRALRDSYLRAARRPVLATLCALGAVAIAVVGAVIPKEIALPYWLTMPALWAALATVTGRRAYVDNGFFDDTPTKGQAP